MQAQAFQKVFGKHDRNLSIARQISVFVSLKAVVSTYFTEVLYITQVLYNPARGGIRKTDKSVMFDFFSKRPGK